MANSNSRSFPRGIKEIRYPGEDVTLRFTSKDYTGTLKLNNETGEFEFDPAISSSDGSSTSFTVSQSAHGFTTGQPLTHNGVKYTLANAGDESTLGLWVVVSVTSEDTFKAAQSGRFELEDHGLTVGTFYFVSETDGGLTSTEPDTYSNPLIYVESDSIIHVLPFRPASSTAGSSSGTGAVDSVFGRTGTVVAESGDYTAEEVGLGNVLNVEQVPNSEKGIASGVATLGTDGKVPDDQLPASVVGGIDIIGFWDADTNTPDLSALTLTQGEAYQVSVAGSTELNSISTWAIYDLVVWDSTVTGNWFKLTSSGSVTSVNDYTGVVVLDTDDIDEGSNEYYTEAKVSANTDVVANTAKVSGDGSIGTHSDVDVTSVEPDSGQVLTFDGTNWVPSTAGSGTVTSVNSYDGVVVLDADDLSDSSTTNKFTTTEEITKLGTIEEGAEVNYISDTDVDDLTSAADSALHYHTSDRARGNHTGTQVASTISDFDTSVSSNADVISALAKVSADASINTHSDVDTNTDTPVSGQSLCWDGSNWTPSYVDGTISSGLQGDILFHDGSDWASLTASTAGYVLSTNGSNANPTWIEGGGASERENTTTSITVDADTTTIDFDEVFVETVSFADGLTSHTIALSNMSTTERYNSLVIDNSDNTSDLTITMDDSSSTISFRNGANDFPGTYPDMNVLAGATWEINFENRSATSVTVGYDELEIN